MQFILSNYPIKTNFLYILIANINRYVQFNATASSIVNYLLCPQGLHVKKRKAYHWFTWYAMGEKTLNYANDCHRGKKTFQQFWAKKVLFMFLIKHNILIHFLSLKIIIFLLCTQQKFPFTPLRSLDNHHKL